MTKIYLDIIVIIIDNNNNNNNKLLLLLLWVLINPIGKIICSQIKNYTSYPTYTKNQLVSWLDNKKQLLWNRCSKFISIVSFLRIISIVSIKKLILILLIIQVDYPIHSQPPQTVPLSLSFS